MGEAWAVAARIKLGEGLWKGGIVKDRGVRRGWRTGLTFLVIGHFYRHSSGNSYSRR